MVELEVWVQWRFEGFFIAIHGIRSVKDHQACWSYGAALEQMERVVKFGALVAIGVVGSEFR